ncbi:P-loop containing nucleoside triphosphate hydrolase protein [Aspergillus sclerotiicarbonarius CBS 121057]|uniref:P-loop containing nucleoside triphosphate hydrolase protein n=1 Tax=Aspergillus sclerotiicarbonarius (strain CBS 121057 / IBT 28362) TaxID=1448318 RepID=A0A319DVY8_ASPSB|nr:P-loop containing nucleoside triphosphate hydrolase protein [Aspergillus sclerotiicarbonarius CBS 121057]
MKTVKMSGFARSLFKRIYDLRDAELNSASKYRTILVWVMGLAYAPSAISPVVTLTIYAAMRSDTWSASSASHIYTAISLIGLVSSPLVAVFQQVPMVVAALSCLDRIEKFLTLPTHKEYQQSSSAQVPQIDSEKQATEFITLLPGQNALTICNASFSYPESSSVVLQDITVNIPRSQLTLIMGPVGSGKSAFLRAIIGEMNLLAGSFRKDIQNCAYCDQSSWLQNETIQNNIIGPDQDFDDELYKKALWACDLEHDLSEIPERDQAKVGSNGISLSGGQKQRISLARAVYARKDLFVLDDSLNALDPRTEENVAQRLLRPNGMMRANGQTVIVASSREGLLPYADFIILLSDNGSIQAQGSPEELAPFFTTQAKGMHLEDDECCASNQITLPTPDSSSSFQKQEKPTEKKKDTPEPAKVSVYLSYLRSMGLWQGLVLCTFLTLQTFFSKFPTVWLQWWLDRSPSTMNNSYTKYIGIYGLFQGAALIFTLLASFQQLRIVMPRTSRYFHSRLLKATMRFSQDMQLIDWNLPVTFLNASEGALGTLAQVIIVASSFPYLFIAFPILFILVLAIQRFYLRTSRQVRAMDIEAKSPLLTHFLETITGLHTMRAFNWQQRSQSSYHSLLSESQRPYYQRFMVQRWLNLVLDMVSAGVAILVVGLAITLPTRSTVVGLALVNVISLNETLQLLILQWAVMEISLGSITRLEEFTIQANAKGIEKSPSQQQSAPTPWPTHGSIIYKDLTAKYHSSGRAILQNINLTIPPTQNGTITIDDIDTASLDPEILQSRIIGIAQQSYILSGVSLRENLLLGCFDPDHDSGSEILDLDDNALISALQKVRLWDTLVQRSELGLEAILDKDLVLSAGQTQLLSLARALLRPGKVVVLDEPASNLPAEMADLVHRVVLDEFRERTVIVIMHQVERLLEFDLAVVVEDGRVVEMGRPRD